MQTTYEDLLKTAKRTLQEARAAIHSEIIDYPTPISGCDAQFNHLLQERQRVTQAIFQLDQPVFIPTPRTPAPNAGVESR
ncbi:hypothetical protein [uncultured Tateyamaria sp.]|uniref:hypothetical protein n=1 Tax=uncultured Tateyamaria sp. TaxID=455651 RepID=UPI00261CAD78|nr:hypothetical protein [uncultured Tateyamaria sp.]